MGVGTLILLDTHVLLWLDQGDAALGERSRVAIEDAWRSSGVAVSAISFWEVAMLVERSRIRMRRSVLGWRASLLQAGVEEWPLDGEVSVRAALYAELHGDPADRFILASAEARGATLLTADQRLLAWRGPVERLDARL